MRGLLVRPLGMSTHLEKPPRFFFLSGLPNEMVTILAAANNAISYILRIHNVYFGSFLGCGRPSNSLPIPGGSGRCTTARTTRPAARGRGREGGMLGGAGGCVAVLIFTLTYHLGHGSRGRDLLYCCRCTP